MRVVTKALLKKIGACDDGTEYSVKSLLGKSYPDAIKQCIADNKLQWANWGIVRVMDGTERVKYAVYAARQVLKLFEDKYKDDKRPREAIEAAERWTRNPSEKNRNAAYATYAASDAANAAVNAAADDTYAAANANAYAADATYAANAYAAAYVAMRIKILKYGILLLSKQAKGEPND